MNGVQTFSFVVLVEGVIPWLLGQLPVSRVWFGDRVTLQSLELKHTFQLQRDPCTLEGLQDIVYMFDMFFKGIGEFNDVVEINNKFYIGTL